MKPSGLLGLRAYAQHRKRLGLPGGQLSSVQQAIAQGKIARTCSAHDRCPPDCSLGGIDPVKADRQWREFSIDSLRSTPTGSMAAPTNQQPTLMSARAMHELIRARLARLELDRRTGELVNKTEVTMTAFSVARRFRDRMLLIPSSVSGRLLLCEEVTDIQTILTEEIKAALLELSTWEQDSTPSSPAPSLESSPSLP